MPGSEVPADGWSGWPQEKQFAFVLTHDVESQKGVDRVRHLAEVEAALGFRSSFNLIPEGPYRVAKELVDWLWQRGFEVGVHDHRHDGKLYRSRKRFEASAGRINHFLREWKAVGFRSGFMLRNLEWIHDLNVLYDASTFDTDPYEPQPEGANTIFPFWISGASGGYVELPYTLAQDSTVFLLLGEKTSDLWKRKLEWIAQHGGMALVNVHPDYISFGSQSSERTEYPLAIYEGFLKWVDENFAGAYWPALPSEVALLVRNRLDKAPRHSAQPVSMIESTPSGLNPGFKPQ